MPQTHGHTAPSPLPTFAERLAAQGSMLYGGDYNPEQWPEEVWKEDMRLFKEAGINEVTLNVFSWAQLQPSENEYDFSKLDRIVRTVSDAGMSIVMATSTGALPAWMSLRHPDVNRVDEKGRKMRHRERHNACINSPTFRTYSVALAGKLAERYGGLPNLVAWHVGNEYGGMCWCDTCTVRFRAWLRARYGTIEAVNEAWNSAFWSHTYHSFDEIFPPNELGDMTGWSGKAILGGYSLDYQRFYGECVLESYNEEKAAIRRFDRVNPVTTNMMGTYPTYDYFRWRAGLDGNGNAHGVDVVSWDSYPRPDTPAASVAMCHELMRGVGGGGPWMLMEQTPSRQNWMPFNAQKRPGQMRQLSWQAVAHGADTVQFFQLRQNRAGCEKFHGALIGSDGTDRTRAFRECAALGSELKRVSGRILGSRMTPARVALVFDWQSRWAIDLSAGPTISMDYVAEVQCWYAELHRRNIPVDIVGPYDEYDSYDVLLAPCLYMMRASLVTRLRRFVDHGGRLLLTALSALTDEHDSLYQGEIPVPLRDLAGVWVEETDALDPDTSVVPLRFADAAGATDAADDAREGYTGTTPVIADSANDAAGPHGRVLFDVLEADEGTEVLATYGSEYYVGTPAFTFRPSTGNGGVFYAATFPDDAAMPLFVDRLLDGTNIAGLTNGPLTGVVDSRSIVPDATVPSDLRVVDLEVTRRVAANGTMFTFVINPVNVPVTVDLPASLTGRDLLTDTDVTPGERTVEPFGVLIVESSTATAGQTA
ncbi:beta-galactosidase [Bifidobacterium sp. 82T10]|uniref:beta-galactosidase n=1 Tax=Bifidobacterium miconis TaxID=2834435 RepID=A0ABS6WJU8_9BIFI|nr:beta-galactosidase [Bifidobacterium miconis]MBW3093532.1 beta-galactosidase [Bifidobacterium miconis]